MASIFKRTRTKPIPDSAEIKPYRGKPHATWTDGNGRKHREPLTDAGDKIIVESPSWYITYTTASGERKTKAGATDKAATERIARKLESTESEYEHGSRDQRAEKLGKHERAPISQHLREFEAAMEGKGVTQKHIANTMSYVRGVIDACGFEAVSDIEPARVDSHIGDLLRQGTSRSGVNHKITALKRFTRWLIENQRLRADPMAGFKKLDTKADRRRQRRALDDDESARLLRAARNGQPWTWKHRGESKRIDGPTRAMLYELALGSGLRVSELESLTVRNVDVADPENATVTVEAGYSKRRSEDHQPIPADVAYRLREHLRGRRRNERAFDVPPSTKAAAMFRIDLRAARAAWLGEVPEGSAEHLKRSESGFLAYCDDAGRYADFHALRHSFITRLTRAGVQPAIAQRLARHGSIQLTLNYYTHMLVEDDRTALGNLPGIDASEAKATSDSAHATGTSDESPSAARSAARSAQTPNRDNAGQRMATPNGGESGKTGEHKPLRIRDFDNA